MKSNFNLNNIYRLFSITPKLFIFLSLLNCTCFDDISVFCAYDYTIARCKVLRGMLNISVIFQ